MINSALKIALLAVFVLCLISATILFGAVLPEYTLPVYGLVALLGVVWAAKLFICRDESMRWAPSHALVLLFAGYALARYFMSPIEYESRLELLHIGLYTLVYFLVTGSFRQSRERLVIVSALVILAAGQSIYALWQYGRQADVVLWLDRHDTYHGRGSGTYFCPNHLAGLLEMSLGGLLARLLAHRRQNGTLQSALLFKLYEFAAAALIVCGLFSTLSRGGWIAMAVAVLFLLVFAELGRVLASRVAIAIFVVLVAAGIWAWNVPQVRTRIQQEVRVEFDLVPGDSPIQIVGGISGRYPIWTATTRMIRDHLWIGTGPGTWQWFHLKYREPRLQIRPQFAHSDVLHLMSDYGMVGTTLIVALLALFYRHAWRILRKSTSSEPRAFALGAATAITAILVHSLADFNLHLPANALWFVALIGLTMAISVGEENEHRRKLSVTGRIVLGIAVLAVAVGIGWFGMKRSLSAYYTSLGYDASQEFEWDEARVYYQRAVSADPRNPVPHSQLGDAYRIESALAEDEDQLPERYRLAVLSINAYRQSLALNPFQSDVMLRLAAAYELAGAYDDAARAYGEALLVDPNNAFTWLRIGMFYRRRGDTERALEAFTFSNRLNNIDPIAQAYLKEIQEEQAASP